MKEIKTFGRHKSPIIINDVEYPSIQKAADAIGVSRSIMSAHYNKVKKSNISEHNIQMSIKKVFTVKVPK